MARKRKLTVTISSEEELSEDLQKKIHSAVAVALNGAYSPVQATFINRTIQPSFMEKMIVKEKKGARDA